jgi:hypothetical protein
MSAHLRDRPISAVEVRASEAERALELLVS